MAAVTRYLTARGAAAINKMDVLKSLRKFKEAAYLFGTEEDRLILSDKQLKTSYRLSMTTKRVTVYCYHWVGALMSEMALYIGIPQENIVIVSLIAGIVTSEKWVPEVHRKIMIEELINFEICLIRYCEALTVQMGDNSSLVSIANAKALVVLDSEKP